ncbi:MAG TPA: hypothetical protein VI248_00460 [Kineosporiaceae bacterium]
MELDEVLRRVLRRYGLLLALLVVVPVVAAAMVVSRMPAAYVSTARVQLTAKTPDTSAAAEAVVSQARALVTSTAVVQRALRDAAVSRDLQDVIARRITVTGLGSSSSIAVSTEDRDPAAAQRITISLVRQLVDVTNRLRLGNLPDGLKSIDDQLTLLATRRAPIAAEAQSSPHDAVVQNRLAGVDRLIADLSASRRDLALQSVTAGRASVIDPANPPVLAEPSRVVQVGFQAAVCAVVIGLLVVAVVETLRPHVSGLPRISRTLQVPPLGTVVVGGRTLELGPGLVQRLRLAARRSRGTIVVVVPIGRVPRLDALVAELGSRVCAPADQAEASQAFETAPSPQALQAAEAAYRAAADNEPVTSGPSPVASRHGDVVLVADRAPDDQTWAHNGAATVGVGAPGAGTHARPADAGVHLVTTLHGLGPAQEGLPIAVLGLTPPVARRSGIDELRELIEISGWPLLGIAQVTRRRWLRRTRER